MYRVVWLKCSKQLIHVHCAHFCRRIGNIEQTQKCVLLHFCEDISDTWWKTWPRLLPLLLERPVSQILDICLVTAQLHINFMLMHHTLGIDASICTCPPLPPISSLFISLISNWHCILSLPVTIAADSHQSLMVLVSNTSMVDLFSSSSMSRALCWPWPQVRGACCSVEDLWKRP